MIAVLLCVILRGRDDPTCQPTKSLLHTPAAGFGMYIILQALSSHSLPLPAAWPGSLKT